MDKTLRFLAKSSEPFAGKTILEGGDFRQCLPIKSGPFYVTEEETIDLSIKHSHLWQHFTTYELTTNLRAQNDPEYAALLLQIGNRTYPTNEHDEIELPANFYTNEDLIDETFGTAFKSNNSEDFHRRVILTPLNRDTVEINDKILDRIQGTLHIYTSIDSVVQDSSLDNINYPVEYLNSLTINDLPLHQLRIKENAMIIIMRNLNINEGICNGTILQVIRCEPHVIVAKHIYGELKDTIAFIPRIILYTNQNGKLPFTLSRHQFPIRLAYVLTINKSQGQTFDFVGLHLFHNVKSHGQLYVALSRVRTSASIKIKLDPLKQDRLIKNIVRTDIL